MKPAIDEPSLKQLESPAEKRPYISVVMPVFNGEKYIDEAINSILVQSISDLELLVINDGSSDGTRKIVDAHAQRDSRIILYNTPNRGIVAALNFGLEKARGEFIARMDADDIAVPGRFQIQLGELTGDPTLVACGGDSIKFGAYSGRVRFPRSDLMCKAYLLFGPCFGHPTVMMRGHALRQLGLWYESTYECAEDYRLWSLLARHGRFSNVGTPLIRHRMHASQISEARRDEQRRAHLSIALHNWADAGVKIDPQLLRFFLWPHLDRLPDLWRYTQTFCKIALLALALGKHRRRDCLWFAARAFFRNVGKRVLTGASA
ncbi:glycosyltransferase family A protein [Burkholderia sp. WP9]|uniref:glycosyltransferase family 2 protein n=1 Tax=Burkholderia sp. WP9 TaxID=1500263 RepID=UPI0015A6D1D7|nr:glycosyltransferase family A protein [Burkholderia sp. WP9]